LITVKMWKAVELCFVSHTHIYGWWREASLPLNVSFRYKVRMIGAGEK